MVGVEVFLRNDSYQYTLKTDEKGVFSKKIYNAKDSIGVEIAHAQYDFLSKKVAVRQGVQTFVLQSKVTEIQQVVLEKGIIEKGGETIYKADFFSNKKENKVIDLLKKLPNVKVDRSGKVSMNGKEVNRVLVEDEVFYR